jgi:hypothetical protein
MEVPMPSHYERALAHERRARYLLDAVRLFDPVVHPILMREARRLRVLAAGLRLKAASQAAKYPQRGIASS